MANDVQALTSFSIEKKTFYERALLESLKESFKFYNLGKKTKLPKHNGNTISWRKFLDLQVPTSPLTEGVIPNANKLEIVEYASTVSQYGDWIPFTDVIDYEGFDPVVAETAKLFGTQIGDMVNGLIVDKLSQTCNVSYAGAKAFDTLTNSDTITVADILKAKAYLKRYKAEPWGKGKYLWFVTPEVAYDLKSTTATNASWVDITKYTNQKDIIEGEIGEFMGFRFIEDNNLKIVDNITGVPVHKTLILGKANGDSPFGLVELEGESSSPKIIHKGLGSAGADDPIDQKQTLGWKIMGFGVRLLYEEAIMCYMCASGLTASNFENSYGENNRDGFSSYNNGVALKITNALTSGKLPVVSSVTITHNGRTDYDYELASADDAKATVSGMVVTRVASGDVNITLTCKQTGESVVITAS